MLPKPIQMEGQRRDGLLLKLISTSLMCAMWCKERFPKACPCCYCFCFFLQALVDLGGLVLQLAAFVMKILLRTASCRTKPPVQTRFFQDALRLSKKLKIGLKAANPSSLRFSLFLLGWCRGVSVSQYHHLSLSGSGSSLCMALVL